MTAHFGPTSTPTAPKRERLHVAEVVLRRTHAAAVSFRLYNPCGSGAMNAQLGSRDLREEAYHSFRAFDPVFGQRVAQFVLQRWTAQLPPFGISEKVVNGQLVHGDIYGGARHCERPA